MESVGVPKERRKNNVLEAGEFESKNLLPSEIYPRFVDEIKHQEVLLFFKYFLAGVEISEPILDAFVNFIVEDENSILAEKILHSDLIKHYPTSKSYQIPILKKIISNLAFQDVHNDTVFEALSNAMLAKNDGGYSYRSFIDTKKETLIVIRKMDVLVTHGTTGMTCWRRYRRYMKNSQISEIASAVLSEYISHFCNFYEKSILELGAGCGLAGITAAKYHNLKNLCLTDGSSYVLEQIKENVQLNFFEEQHYNITIQKLDWDHFNEADIIEKPNVILGADLLYNEFAFPRLAETLNKLLINEESYALFAHNIRNRCTLETFFDIELARLNLKPIRICQALLPKDGHGITFAFEDGRKTKIADEIFCSNYSFEIKTIMDEEIILAEIFKIRRKNENDFDHFNYFLAGLSI